MRGEELDFPKNATSTTLLVGHSVGTVSAKTDCAREAECVGEALCDIFELLSAKWGVQLCLRYWMRIAETNRSAGDRTCESDQSRGWCKEAKPDVSMPLT